MTDVHTLFITCPTAEQLQTIIGLYRQAGWWPAQEAEDYDQMDRLVRQSHCFVVAMSDGRIIGMGRAISDGVSDAYVQDVTVDLAWRGSGVGTRIVRHILERLRADGIGWVALIAERGSSPFYTSLGFEEMVNAAPMLLKW
jgi:GNAT superfamily N-acetyltransferase